MRSVGGLAWGLPSVAGAKIAGQVSGCRLDIFPVLSGPPYSVPLCELVGLPHSMAAQSSKSGCPGRNHAEAALPFVTWLRSKGIAFAGSRLPRRGERQHGEGQRRAIRMCGMTDSAVVLSGKCDLSQIERAESECCHCVT